MHRFVDLRKPLPFAAKTFSTVLASLCLHYFEWQKAKEIVAEIHRRLRINGIVIVRINTTSGVHYGAVGFEEISPNLYKVHGKSKRFFSKAMLNELFSAGSEILLRKQRIIDRYERLKSVWQLVARSA